MTGRRETPTVAIIGAGFGGVAAGITLRTGETFECRVLISDMGFLNVPWYPTWPGLELFEVPKFHTARWERQHDLTGKTVGIVGTGSSATQIVPAIAPIVNHVHLFDREPGWVIPKGDRDYTPEERVRWRNSVRHRWMRAKGFWALERSCWRRAFWKPGTKANEQGRAGCLAFIDEVFADRPDLKLAGAPTYPYPGKRPIFNSTYHPALERDDVELVPHAVTRMTPKGVVDTTGVERQVDVLVLPTGFQPTDYLARVEVLGTGGRTLTEYWNGEPRAFLGTTVPGFPNFFILYGPGTNGGELVTSLLAHSSHALRSIQRVICEGTTAVEAQPLWADVYHAWLRDGMRDTSWVESRNYFKNAAEKIVTQWPYGAQAYRQVSRLLSRPSETTRALPPRSVARASRRRGARGVTRSPMYDLVIRDGVVVDGSGRPRYSADVAISQGRIARIDKAGRLRESTSRSIDAAGRVVAPGFIDGHTHLDAQIAWDPLGTSACWHGVTTALMGNCGFTLAPSRAGERDLVLDNLERAEDIPAAVLQEGITWGWETFSEYLDVLEALPKGIHYGCYVGHSALRTYAMGARAFGEEATADDLDCMVRELRAALRAGAIGFSTSRTRNHRTPDGRPVASVDAPWSEVRALVEVMGELGAGIFQIASEDDAFLDDAARDDFHARLLDLALQTRRPITWGLGSLRQRPDHWRPWLALLEQAADRGGRMFAHVHARQFGIALSFQTHLPFDTLPVWRELRARPLVDQERALRVAAMRKRLVAEAEQGAYATGMGAEARPPDYEWIFVLDRPTGALDSVASRARAAGRDPVEWMIEWSCAHHLEPFFLQVFSNEDQGAVLEMLKHPLCVVAFSDSGAHVSQLIDSSIPTYLLGHWVRERGALTLEEAVRMLTHVPARAWELSGRGLLQEGFAADLVIFDPDEIAPELPELAHDLPGGARRLVQRARGVAATIVEGEIVLHEGEPTGARPGRLLRSRPGQSSP